MCIHRKWAMAALLIITFSFTACSQTKVTGTWKKSDYTGQPFDSILVVGLVGDTGNKILWENVMADKLRQTGVKTVITSAGAFPDAKKIGEKEITDYVAENTINAVLVTRLVDTRKEEVYYPPSGGYYREPFGYYNRFNPYYSHAYDMIYSPGYTDTLTTILLETNLYRVDTRELIWSMSSNTFDPSSFSQLVDSVSKIVLEKLQQDNLI